MENENLFYPNEKWTLAAKRADFYGLAKIFGIDPIVVRLLVNRGANTEEKIKAYLGKEDADFYDATLMKDLSLAADIVLKHIDRGNKIVIASDYDADGVFSGELLYEALRMLGADACVITPHRVTDGYGLNRRIVDEAVGLNAGLILTCDNGISAFDAVDYANQQGLEVVITDHHEVPYDEDVNGNRIYRIPNALAVVDPHQEDCSYPYKGLCGCGVALKLTCEIFKRRGIEVPDVFYEYAAIATVCDVMTLDDENRSIVKKGISTLKDTENIGLSALISLCQIDRQKLGAYHIGFVLGPCFNAAGRLESADKAIELLRAKTVSGANQAASYLISLNDKRKTLTEDGVLQAISIIEEKNMASDNIILVRLEECHESIAGIVAGRIRERYNRPAIILVKTEDCYKGSGRSMEGYHMYEELSRCKDMIVRYGGHALAAGLSIEEQMIEKFRDALNDNCPLTDDDWFVPVRIDMELPLQYINEELIRQFSLLEPFGNGNEKPLFAERGYKISKPIIIGKNNNILKMRVTNETGASCDALLFSGAEIFVNMAKERYGNEQWEKAELGEDNEIRVDLAFYPDVNEFRGVRTIQINISHYRFR